ncbi:hypothetical protein I312_105233 [Cryptococcus bacillisporus CA1280]|uniref:uncharacterized protein n=1 Tax=Cryptococcus bacillisporus CA1280 TaxID=1296109 RepID=UPI00336815F8
MATFAFPTSLKADDPLAIPFADADLSPSGAFAEGTGPDKPKDEQGKEAFACTIPGCLQIYSRAEYLKRHLRKHENNRPFLCKDCFKTFTRSDVLLRHHRRCHAPSPSADLSSNSSLSNNPQGNMLTYSSRIDAREASPSREGPRKPGRHGTTEGESVRARVGSILEDDHDDKDKDRKHSGVYHSSDIIGSHPNCSQFLPSSSGDRTNLALNDSNQLDDASALLNIEYTTGVASNNVQLREESGLPIWEDDPAVNLIMAVATSGDDNCPNEGGFSPPIVEAQSQSVASISENPRASISSLVGSGSELSGQVNVDSNLQDFGSFIYPIWSSGIETQEGTNVLSGGPDSFSCSMMQSPRGTSFSTTSHQSPSIPYRLPSHSSSSNTRSRSQSDVHGHSQQSHPLNVLQILEQLVPQTAANLDPERPLLRVAHAELADRAGNGLDPRSRSMRRTLFLPICGKFDQMHEKSDREHFQLLRQSNYGPFARTALMITLLRGIIDIGEGKRDRGNWRDLTDLWDRYTLFKPGKMMLAQDGINMGPFSRKGLKDIFRSALQTWREGWDCDSRCAPPTMTHMNIRSTVTRPESSWSEGSLDAPEEEEMLKTTINYCEDALPLYWLAQTLQDLLVSDSSQLAGTNIFSNLRYNNMLKAARIFARTGEGLPTGASNLFRS